MSKYDIPPLFVCQNRILNVKIRYSAPVQISKQDFECQNWLFRPILNFRIGFERQNIIFGLNSNVKIGS